LHLYELGLAQVKGEICSYAADGVSIDIPKLLASPAASTILHEVLSEFHFKSAEIEVVFKKISSFSDSSACQSGATFYSSSHVAALHRGHLVVAPIPGSLSLTLLPETGDIELPTGRLCIARFDRDSLTEIPRSPLVCCLDVDSIKGHLAIRSTTEGDRFNPFGMKGTKLVSDYLTDCHRSIIEKRRAMVVVDEEKILWLVGERPDGRATITDQTKQVVMLSFSPKE
jgi:tRNA(Ile)-lysidine synthase